MSSFLEFFTWAALLPVLTCGADQIPAPTLLTYTWLDPFTVEVFWQHVTIRGCNISYRFCPQDDMEKGCRTTTRSSIAASCVTQESDRCTFVITATSHKCSLKNSEAVKVDVLPQEPHVGALEDFVCVIGVNKTNCSWRAETFLNLTLSYRICGASKEHFRNLTECGEHYQGEQRNGCYLYGDIYIEDICMLLRTREGSRTFSPRLVLEPPKFSVSREGDQLRVTWMKPDVLEHCPRKYQLHYSMCGKPQDIRESRGSDLLFYNKACLYEFKSRITSLGYCKRFQSNFGDIVYYGANEPPDQTFLVVAVLVPIALSICVLLPCICLRRYRHSLCPRIPDVPAMIKEWTVNYSSDQKKFQWGDLHAQAEEQVNICTVVPAAAEPDS